MIQTQDQGVRTLVERLTAGQDDLGKAKALFDTVRDQIAYEFTPTLESRASWSASHVLARGRGFCGQKAATLTTLMRAAGLTVGVGLADIRDHTLAGTRFAEHLPDGIIVVHGFVWWFHESQWWVMDPTLDSRLCQRAGFRVTELVPGEHARLPETTLDGRAHFDILVERGPFVDFPETVTALALTLQPTWAALRLIASGR